MNLLYIGMGGAFGSIARYLCARGIYRLLGAAFPWGTLGVNILGGLLAGVLISIFAVRFLTGDHSRLFLITGFLGGFTTFSAFTVELVDLLQRGQMSSAFIYLVSSVIVSMVACAGGLLLTRGFLT